MKKSFNKMKHFFKIMNNSLIKIGLNFILTILLISFTVSCATKLDRNPLKRFTKNTQNLEFENDRPLIGILNVKNLDNYKAAIFNNGGNVLLLSIEDFQSEVSQSRVSNNYCNISNKKLESFKKLDGILLPGGPDIHPLYYKAEDNPVKYNTEYDSIKRDEAERIIINCAKLYKIPLLGVCRGMQAINIFYGPIPGHLFQDIPSLNLTPSICHRGKDCSRLGSRFGTGPAVSESRSGSGDMPVAYHNINILTDSRLYSILSNKKRVKVNSYHHQSVKSLGPDLKIVARADDQIVEAIESKNPNHFVLGIQFHPEIMIVSDPNSELNQIYKYFVDIAKKHHFD